VKKTTQLLFLLLGVAGVLMANPGPPPGVPELDPGSGVAALALISGTLLVIRARRRT